MSKTPMPYQFALEQAQAFVEYARPACERIEIAGSLRRKKPEVGDIEVVCIPRYRPGGLFNDSPVSELDDLMMAKYPIIKGKDHYQQYVLTNDPQYGDIHLDLFITTPACWGVNFTLRTGSADFSHWLVTWRKNGGALPSNMYVRDARLCLASGPIDTPEEKDFFKAIGLGWIEPEQRTEGRWKR
jgi:DNA polymerase/3'-5' exonuclease PolX